MKIEFEVVDRKHMRYPTAGDYYEDKEGTVHIVVVETKNWKYNCLLLIHEFVEFVLIRAAGVPISVIDDFDKDYEKEREMGMHALHDEPGDDLDAPYHSQHSIATAVERLLAVVLRIHWADYAHIVDTMAFGGGSKSQKAGKRR